MKKRLTVRELVADLRKHNNPLIPINVENPPEWLASYNEHSATIDRIAIKKFGSFVLDSDESSYSEYFPDYLLDCFAFYYQRKLTYDKLWEIESITFNPINNYDSHKKSTMVRTGTENDTNNREYGKTTENTQSGAVIDSLVKSGSETVATKNNQTETNARELNTAVDITAKNNQSVTVTDTKKQSYTDKHTLTAYANNEVDATERTYAGDGDTNVTSFSGEGDTTNTVNSGTDTVTKSYTGNADTTEQSFDKKKKKKTMTYNDLKNVTAETVTKDTEEHIKTYNAVTDTFEETQSGNIGVTTSTAMLSEFVNFYSNYSFFERLISDFVQFICRADFETEVE